jgi:hypothetical protein
VVEHEVEQGAATVAGDDSQRRGLLSHSNAPFQADEALQPAPTALFCTPQRPARPPSGPQVSAFVRAQLYEPEMTLNGGCLDVLDPLISPAAERQLLVAVEDLYTRRVLPAALEPISVAQGFGATPEHADPVLFAVLHHFRSRQRWLAARTFFARLGAIYPPAAIWEAVVLRGLGRSDAVIELLGSALEHSPSSPLLLAAMATECMRLQQVGLKRGGRLFRVATASAQAPCTAGKVCTLPSPCAMDDPTHDQVDTAARLARRAVQLQPRCRPAWLLLARCYTAENRFAEALVTLNAVPTPPLPRDERELLLVVPPPDPARVTTPQVRGRVGHGEGGITELRTAA